MLNRFFIIFPFFTKNLIKNDVEYRGKIVVSNRENDKIYYAIGLINGKIDNYNFEILNNLLRGKEVGEDGNIDRAKEKIDTVSTALKQAQILVRFYQHANHN